MVHVVLPALALLNADAAPLIFRHEVILGNQLANLLRQHNVSATQRNT